MINTGSSADILFYDAFKRMGFTKALLKQELTPLIGFAGETTYSLGSIDLAITADITRKTLPIQYEGSPINLSPMPEIPDPKRIETIRGIQKSLRSYLASFKDIKSSSIYFSHQS
ncbi:hypothetical protein Bca4012_051555 [Brassica carinata]